MPWSANSFCSGNPNRKEKAPPGLSAHVLSSHGKSSGSAALGLPVPNNSSNVAGRALRSPVEDQVFGAGQTKRPRAAPSLLRCRGPEKGVAVNLDTLETINGTNGVEVDDGSEDLETTWREMQRFVDEIEQNSSLLEIPGDDWEVYVEYCAALGQPVSARDVLRRKHPELYPEEIDFMLSPPSGDECPF